MSVTTAAFGSRARLMKGEVRVGGCLVPYATLGTGPQPLVLVNGLQQTMASWAAALRYFRADPSVTLVMFELPGQGRAAIAAEATRLSFLEQVQILATVIAETSGGRPVDLLAGSWGALLSAAYAATRPQRVRRMVLGSFSPRPNAFLRSVVQRGLQLVASGQTLALAELFLNAFGGGLPAGHRDLLRRQFASLTADHLRLLQAQGTLIETAGDLGTLADLTRISAPTLIVHGEDDPLVDLRDAQQVASLLPDCRIEVVRGVGHFLHLEDPRVFDLYGEFFRQEMRAAA